MMTNLFPMLRGEYLYLFFTSGVRVPTLTMPAGTLRVDSVIMETECTSLTATWHHSSLSPEAPSLRSGHAGGQLFPDVEFVT